MQRQHKTLFQFLVIEVLMPAVMGLLIVWTLAGFAHAKPKSYATIPNSCMHNINITDFHKPCRLDEKNPNVAHCDDVVIHFACLNYGETSITK